MPKFSEIPQFLTGNYGADVPLGYLERWLTSQGDELDLDPDFQRGHVWTPDQQSRFMEFLLRGGKSSRTIYWNHPSYTNSPSPNCSLPPKLVIVDGKQRLTTLRLFLQDKVNVFGHPYSQYEDPKNILGPSGPNLRMQINNLQTRKEVLQWYLELNDGGTVHTSEELTRVRSLMTGL